MSQTNKIIQRLTVFVEQSSTIECYHHPPPNLETIGSKQACFIKEINISSKEK
jgi:hypothetical protein